MIVVIDSTLLLLLINPRAKLRQPIRVSSMPGTQKRV